MEKKTLDKGTRPSVPEGSCHFYVERKKRYCRFRPSQGVKYCAEHAAIMGADLGRKRVTCPYEPKHTCYEDKLKHHMKKCPSRPKEMPTYYSANINSGDDAGEMVPEPKETIRTIPEDDVKSLIDKVNQLYDEHVGSVAEEILSHDCLQAELNNQTYGNAALRHRKQQASLIGHMNKLGLLKDDMCYLEMGAGKGQLSHWLHEAVQQYKDNVFVLIDRSHVRNKMDNLHKEEEVMERLRIDIEHLRLDKVPTIEKYDKPIVAFGKHLCGPATDLSLRCVCETLHGEETTKGDEEENKRKKLRIENRLGGAVIALCCHHRCAWRPYVGKAFFRSCGLTAKDFQIISSMSSWATCAWKGWSADKKQKGKDADKDLDKGNEATSTSGNSLTDKKDNIGSGDGTNSKSELEKDKSESEKDNSSSVDTERSSENVGRLNDQQMEENDVEEEHKAEELEGENSINKQYSQEEREIIGRKCKRLIDHGRLQYLEEHGLKTSMKMYIEQFYTPENIVLLAAS